MSGRLSESEICEAAATRIRRQLHEAGFENVSVSVVPSTSRSLGESVSDLSSDELRDVIAGDPELRGLVESTLQKRVAQERWDNRGDDLARAFEGGVSSAGSWDMAGLLLDGLEG